MTEEVYKNWIKWHGLISGPGDLQSHNVCIPEDNPDEWPDYHWPPLEIPLVVKTNEHERCFDVDVARGEKFYLDIRSWIETQLKQGRWADKGKSAGVYTREHMLEMPFPKDLLEAIPHYNKNTAGLQRLVVNIAMYDILQDMGVTLYRDTKEQVPSETIKEETGNVLLLRVSYVHVLGTLLKIRDGLTEAAADSNGWKSQDKVDDAEDGWAKPRAKWLTKRLSDEHTGLNAAVTQEDMYLDGASSNVAAELSTGNFLKAVRWLVADGGGGVEVDYAGVVEDMLLRLLERCEIRGARKGEDYDVFFNSDTCDTDISLNTKTLQALKNACKRRLSGPNNDLAPGV